MVQVRSLFRVTDIPEGQVVGNHGNWLLETGSLHTVPKGRLAARRRAGGWWDERVENKGWRSLFQSRAHFRAGVRFFAPKDGFPATWVWDRPLLIQSTRRTPKFVSGLRSFESTAASSPLFPARLKEHFYSHLCLPSPPRQARTPVGLPQCPADRTSVSDGNGRRPLFLEVSGPLVLLRPPWRPARDGGKPGHRPGPERR